MIFSIMHINHTMSGSQILIAARVLKRVIGRTKEELGLCAAIFASFNLVFASLMMLAEHGHGSKVFDHFFSFLWWSCTTLTTVSYGDMYPVTIAGRIIAMVAMFCGIMFFALPTSILGAAWVTELQAEGII